jgi:hypothetical protein
LLTVVSPHVVKAMHAIRKLPSRRLFPQPGQHADRRETFANK